MEFDIKLFVACKLNENEVEEKETEHCTAEKSLNNCIKRTIYETENKLSQKFSAFFFSILYKH